MPTFSNFYNDGTTKWSQKVNIQSQAPSPALINPEVNDKVIDGLVGIDIKTNIQGRSIKIQKGATIIGHFELSQSSSWELSGNQITLNSSDEIPVILSFINATEALIGDDRLTIALNGGIIA